nr:hypothetical protein [Tanacetum cinerariifolium]
LARDVHHLQLHRRLVQLAPLGLPGADARELPRQRDRRHHPAPLDLPEYGSVEQPGRLCLGGSQPHRRRPVDVARVHYMPLPATFFWRPLSPLALRAWLGLTLGLGLATPLHAQNAFQGMEELFTPPKGYVVQHTNQPLTLDGNLQESDWQKAAWTTDFVDIEGAKKPLPTFQTRVKMLWNDSTLFVAATLQEPQIWAYQTHHDDIIYKDNDFEIFIDPDN